MPAGRSADLTFGTTGPGELYDTDLTTGWGHRPANWEFSAGVQHEIMPRVALDVGYFRRIWKNFQVTDNLLLAPEDFTQFQHDGADRPAACPTAAQTLDGLYNVMPTKFGLVDNLNTLSDKYGKQIEHWNGFDVSINARLQNGLTLQGGLSTGKQIEDNCEVVAKLPEMLNLAAVPTAANTARAGAVAPGAVLSPRGADADGGEGSRHLHRPEDRRAGVRLVPQHAGHVAVGRLHGDQRYPRVVIRRSAGRSSGNAARTSCSASRSRTQTYTERRQELDMRIGKVVRFGNTRSVLSMDMYNALNSDAMIVQNQAYASCLRPVEILNARLIKFSWAFDF